jgi:hypothetical protein
MRFTYQVLAISLFLFVSYTLTLLFFPRFQNQLVVQNWWQENKIKAENFFHKEIKADIIIVGTSMSEGLILNPSKGKALTLNFIGGSSQTGLTLIKHSALIPKILIIETNWLERLVNEDLVATVSHPEFNELKTVIPSLLESNQPVNVLAALVKIKPTFINTLKEKRYFQSNLKKNVEDNNVNVDTLKVEKAIKEAKHLINYFINKGVKIYLMEIPFDSRLLNTNRVKITKLSVNKYLKDIDSIPNFKIPSLETSDGYHFTAKSKKVYIDSLTNFLNHQL